MSLDHDCAADLAVAFAPTLHLLAESGLNWSVECLGGNCYALCAEFGRFDVLVSLSGEALACGYSSSDGDVDGWHVGWQDRVSGDADGWWNVPTGELLATVADVLLEVSVPREDVPGSERA